MIEKTIDFRLTVYELVTKYPEIITILKELGFEQITQPGMIQTAGRVMTIPKGCRLKGILFDKVKETFQSKGFRIKE